MTKIIKPSDVGRGPQKQGCHHWSIQRAGLLFLLTVSLLVLPSTAQAQTQTGVCDRTPQVRDALVAIVGGEASCAEVTADQLGRISVLSLGSERIETLQSGDFAGLSSLEQLDLYDNELTALPPNVFAGLTNLRQLNLWHNDLASLSPNVFADLTNLRVFGSRRQRLRRHPARRLCRPDQSGVLVAQRHPPHHPPVRHLCRPDQSGVLGGLWQRIHHSSPDVFANLTNLQTLRLRNNSLTTLPSDIFTGLTNLQSLWLHDNHLTALSAQHLYRPDQSGVLVSPRKRSHRPAARRLYRPDQSADPVPRP